MADPISTTIFGMVTDAFISALAGKVTDKLLTKLKGDPARNAFKQALHAAIQRYRDMEGSRSDLAQPLLQPESPLAEQAVAKELTQLIRFDREPDTKLIGERWRLALDNPSHQWRNFTSEAELFIACLKVELWSTDIFRPIFEAKLRAESLANIEAQLNNLASLLNARFGELIRAFDKASRNIRDQIFDYTFYIEDKTRGFVGRQFVFNEVDQFIQSNPRGYFLIRGDPGIGKSALAAEIVKTKGYVHHFNIRARNINTADWFLTNICSQLIAAYDLDKTLLPLNATQNDFTKILGQAANKQLGLGDKVVIVVDALDEVDTTSLAAGVNPLYLPETIPPGVYIIVTMRNDKPLHLRIDCEQYELLIMHNSDDNLTDIRDKVKKAVKQLGIKNYIATQGIDDETFIAYMTDVKSEGNFMYLHHVLPEIERGTYKDLKLEALPVGLQNYYEDHWRRMRAKDEEAWFTYKLPVLAFMTLAREPVSIDLIATYSNVRKRARIQEVLEEWNQFLHKEQIEYQSGFQERYWFYHTTFHEFIARQDQVAEERVDLKGKRRRMANTMWKKLAGD